MRTAVAATQGNSEGREMRKDTIAGKITITDSMVDNKIPGTSKEGWTGVKWKGSDPRTLAMRTTGPEAEAETRANHCDCRKETGNHRPTMHGTGEKPAKERTMQE